MTGDEILDQWHDAKLAHQAATGPAKDEAYLAMQAAEKAAIDHFGLGKHLKAYKARYP